MRRVDTLKRGFLYIICFTTLYFISSLGFGQTSDSVVTWSHRPLKWEDFRGTPDPSDPIHAAVTFAGIHLEIDKVDFWTGKITFKAKALFYKSLSWTKELDPHVLFHEQLHFDLTELYARRLEAKLNAMNITSRNKSIAKRLCNQFNKAHLLDQEQFDEETAHGQRSYKQKEWQEKIHNELARHKAI